MDAGYRTVRVGPPVNHASATIPTAPPPDVDPEPGAATRDMHDLVDIDYPTPHGAGVTDEPTTSSAETHIDFIPDVEPDTPFGEATSRLLDRARRTFEAIRHLSAWKFEPHEIPPPHLALHRAMRWVHQLRELVQQCGLEWHEPNVTTDGEGRVVLEWWSQERKITVYIDEEGEEFIASWGRSIFDEMEEGAFENPKDALERWAWMTGEERGRTTP